MKQTEPAHFSGRLEHPTMYVFSVWGDDILKYLLDSSLFILTYVSYSGYDEKYLCILSKVVKFATKDRHLNISSFQSYIPPIENLIIQLSNHHTVP